MSNVVDFTGNSLPHNEKPTKEHLVSMFNSMIDKVDSIQDVLFFIKDNDDGFSMFYSDLNIQERSFLLQMLQHDIHQELTQEEELVFEPEL